MSGHEQIWAKVNVPVDRGVAGLVAALSEFPGLETVESCEGSTGKPAWVCFRFGRYWESEEPWRETAEFALGFLAPRLLERVGDSVSLSVTPRGSGVVLADLTVRPGTHEDVRAALAELAAEYQRLPTP